MSKSEKGGWRFTIVHATWISRCCAKCRPGLGVAAFADGNRPVGEVHQRMMEALPRLSQLLDEGASLLIHCSAGIHRTGTVAYGLLRWRGESWEEAMELIGQMRLVTLNEVGEKRLRCGDAIARVVPGPPTAWLQALQEFISQFW